MLVHGFRQRAGELYLQRDTTESEHRSWGMVEHSTVSRTLLAASLPGSCQSEVSGLVDLEIGEGEDIDAATAPG